MRRRQLTLRPRRCGERDALKILRGVFGGGRRRHCRIFPAASRRSDDWRRPLRRNTAAATETLRYLICVQVEPKRHAVDGPQSAGLAVTVGPPGTTLSRDVFVEHVTGERGAERFRIDDRVAGEGSWLPSAATVVTCANGGIRLTLGARSPRLAGGR